MGAGEANLAKESTKRAVRWDGVPTAKDARREAILRLVANMLRDSRLSSFTIQDVADELGMTKGNLYYYFTDKQDLVYQCHMRSMELSLAALKAASEPSLSPPERMRVLLERHIQAVVSEGFGGVLQTDLDSLSEDRRSAYIRKRDQFERGVRSIIEAGIATGDFECGNVKLAGFTILGAINWIPKWYRPKGPFTVDQISEQMTDLLIKGLVPKGQGTSDKKTSSDTLLRGNGSPEHEHNTERRT